MTDATISKPKYLLPEWNSKLGKLGIVAAIMISVGIVFARAPMTQVPDALFVSDGFGYYIYLPSVVIDHDLDFSNQITRLPYEGEKRFFATSDITGRRTNQFPIGSAMLWAPFFLLADFAVRLLNMLGAEIPRTGFGFWYELPAYIGSFLYGLVGVWILHRTLRQCFDRIVSDAALVAIVFATPTAYYLFFESNMSHNVALFVMALWCWQLVRIDRTGDTRIRSWLLLGITLGMAALIRPYNGLLGLTAIPVALTCQRAGQTTLFSPARLSSAVMLLLTCCIASLMMMIPQVAVWKYLYGTWIAVPKGSGYEAMSWFGPRVFSYALSGVALWPINLMAFAGLLWAGLQCCGKHDASDENRERLSKKTLCMVAPMMLLSIALVNWFPASSRDWMLGTAFGQRRLVDWSPLMSFGVAWLLSGQGWFSIDRPWVRPAIAVLVVINLFMVPVYLFSDIIPEYGQVW